MLKIVRPIKVRRTPIQARTLLKAVGYDGKLKRRVLRRHPRNSGQCVREDAGEIVAKESMSSLFLLGKERQAFVLNDSVAVILAVH